MAMASLTNKVRLSFHRRLFLLLLAFSWVIILCFVGFQYNREKQFKAEHLDARLQLFNIHLLDALQDSVAPNEFIEREALPFKDLRVSIITNDGKVIYDNILDKLPETNHLMRPEIQQALKNGIGYTVRRKSESDSQDYFYSAMKGNNVIVRSAEPYSVTLGELLQTDKDFLWFMLLVTAIISICGYFATRKLGRTIVRLSEFTAKAERGERIYDDETFPHDELGEISHNIIRLYARLQTTIAERDKEHQSAMYEQQEKIRIKRQLTNNINHELKTPIASIQVCLETIKDKPNLPQSVHDDLINRCYTNCDRLIRLLDDVSMVTRMDEGAEQIRKDTVSLNSIVNEVIDDMSLRQSSSAFEVHVSMPENLYIEGNQSMLFSIFRNLIANSLAYSGGKNIYINAVEQENNVLFTFADDGIGVDEQHLPHLFERFYRVDKGRSRKLGGTGLGLAIVKHAVMIHGGTINVKNRKPSGLCFTFSLNKQ
jgi:signal transduction histidine kinase